MTDAGAFGTVSTAPSNRGTGMAVNVYPMTSDGSGNVTLTSATAITGILTHLTIMPGTCENSFTMQVQDSDMDVADVASVYIYRGTSLPNTKNTTAKLSSATVPLNSIKNTVRFVGASLGATKTVTVKIYYLTV